MLSSLQRKLGKMEVRIMLGADNDKLGLGVCKEIVSCPVMLRLRVVHCTMFPRFDIAFGRLGTLEKRIYLQVVIWQNPRQMENVRGRAVADKSNLDRRHVEKCWVDARHRKLVYIGHISCQAATLAEPADLASASV